MTFATRYNPNKPVKFDLTNYEPDIITEQTGYRNTKEIVEQMILAGKKVVFARHLMYATEDEYEQDIRDELAEKYAEMFDIEDIPEAEAKVNRMIDNIIRNQQLKEARERPQSDEMELQGEIIPEESPKPQKAKKSNSEPDPEKEG